MKFTIDSFDVEELGPTKALIMGYIRNKPYATPARIESDLKLTRATITKSLKGLEEAGYITLAFKYGHWGKPQMLVDQILK